MIAGLGYSFNSQHQLQLSYIHQHIWNFGNTIQENNPTLRFSYVTAFQLVQEESIKKKNPKRTFRGFKV